VPSLSSSSNDPSFDIGGPERYRKDVPKAEAHVVDGGHFALDTRANEIAEFIDQFMQGQR
jgi:surfactin synthase thioesterase subunit